MTVCYPADTEYNGNFGSIVFYGFNENHAKSILEKVLQSNEYDVYHVWGTEYRHSLNCIEILDQLNRLDRCVVSIQGLVSICATHYADGLSDKIIKRTIRKDWRHAVSIQDEVNNFTHAGEREKIILSKVRYAIGRTDWDRACLNSINPSLLYYKCNENLREVFYGPEWNINSVKRNTVFVSQCSYPIKGMHYLIEALPLVKKRIPDIKLITTGENILKSKKKQIELISKVFG